MAEDKAKTTEAKSVGKVEVPAKAEVTRTPTLNPEDIPQINVTATPQYKGSQFSNATDSVKGKKETYTVDARKSIYGGDMSAVIQENVATSTVTKNYSQSERVVTKQNLSDSHYGRTTTTYTQYKDKRTAQSSETTTGYSSYALAQSRGYADHDEWQSSETHTTTIDRKGNDRGVTSHYESASVGKSIKSDFRDTMKKDGTLARYARVSANHNVVDHPDKAYLRQGDNSGETFYAGMNDKGTHYKVHNTKTGEDTYLYSYSDGKVDGYSYNETTKEYKALSEKKIRKMLKRDAKRAEKVISGLAGKDIRTLDDYYNSLPTVEIEGERLNPMEFFEGDLRYDTAYQQKAQEMGAANRQRLAESRMVTAEDIVAAKMQQYKSR